MATILWIVIGIVLLFWVLGLVFEIAGGLIHLLLLVAAAIFIFNLISGRRGAA